MKLYHNAACGKSRIAHKHLSAKHPKLQVHNYLEIWLSAEELLALMARSEHAAEEFVRWDDARMLGIKLENKNDPQAVAELLARQPKVLQRPLLDDGEQVWIVRSDEVLQRF